MEIKSNNVLVGTFALLAVLGVFGFLLWLGQLQVNKHYAYYEVIFQGSVSGLKNASAVQYNGLPIGTVTDLHLADDDPNKVVAILQLDPRTPVKEDSVAKLQMSGITGVAQIEITGGSAGSKSLKALNDEPYPIIPSAPSALQELQTTGPEMIQNANKLITQVTQLVVENQTAIKESIENLKTITGTVAANTGQINEAIGNLNLASSNMNALSRNADQLVNVDARAFVAEARQAAANYNQVAENLDALVKRNGPAFDRFSESGLSQVPLLIQQTRQAVAVLDRLVSRAQQDPSGFLLGNNVPEVSAK